MDAGTPARLIAEFGSLGAVLNGSRTRQRRASASDAAILRISRFRAAMLHVLRPCAIDRPVLADWTAVNGYLRLDMAFAAVERFRVLYLDAANRLLRDVVVSEGTIDRTCVSIRELLREALDLGAASLIVAHNHPTGHPGPSAADRALTEKLSAACSTLDVELIDHVIVGAQGTFSFRGAGLIP